MARKKHAEPNLKHAVELVMELMAIPGKSGEEAEVAQRVIDLLRAAGAPQNAIKMDAAFRKTPIDGKTGNLVLKLPGTKRGPRRMLVSHLDTVPICVGSQPRRRKNIVTSAAAGTGLGADNRAGCGVILTAALEILKHDLPHPPLTFLWTVQEEIGLQGARNVRLGMLGKPKLAFNWDGGAPNKLTIGATGGYRIKIEIEGIASHAGGAPEEGVSAIAIAGIAIADLHRNGWHGDIHKGSKHGTSNIGFIHAGEATNVVTDRAMLKAEARSHDAKFRQRITREIEKAFLRAAKEVKNVAGKCGKIKLDGQLDYDSFKMSTKEPCVQVASQAIQAIGQETTLAIANGGLDANWLFRHGIPTVSFGCGQLNQHMATEALDVKNYENACRIALLLATGNEVDHGT
jgi:tripeptide aminopeptidase